MHTRARAPAHTTNTYTHTTWSPPGDWKGGRKCGQGRTRTAAGVNQECGGGARGVTLAIREGERGAKVSTCNEREGESATRSTT